MSKSFNPSEQQQLNIELSLFIYMSFIEYVYLDLYNNDSFQ